MRNKKKTKKIRLKKIPEATRLKAGDSLKLTNRGGKSNMHFRVLAVLQSDN